MSDIKIVPDYFTTLKTQMNAEMNRRNQYGSMVFYAGADYQYATAPAIGSAIKLEHVDKNLRPLLAINPKGKVPLGAKFFAAADKAAMDAYLATYSARAMTANVNDCAAQCSGLCITQCTGTCMGGCTSCSGACQGSCQGSCYGGCADGCENSCNGNCSHTCFGYGTGQDGCSMMCSGNCQDSCDYSCARAGN